MGGKVLMERLRSKLVATIPNGTALSNAINLEGHVIFSLGWPNGWTAADLQFQASFDGGVTFAPVYDDAATRVKIASASLSTAEARIYVNKTILEQLAGLTIIKLESSTNQGADRVIVVSVKG